MSAIQKRLSNMEVRFDESEVVVVDMGTGYIKAGYSGEDLPRVTIPTVVSERENFTADETMGPGDSKPNKVVSKKFGRDAYESRNEFDLHHPIQRGVVTDWNRMEDLLGHVFLNELGIEPRSATVLMTDSPMSRKEDKQRLAQIMFENFRFKAFALQNTAVLSLFSNGLTTGLVAESGEGLTYTVPVFEGYALPHAMQTIDVSGQEVTRKLIQELQESQVPVTEDHFHYIREVKEKMCHVSMNYPVEMDDRHDDLTQEERSYELPDQQIIEVSHRKRITAAECMFDPTIVDVRHPEFEECKGGIAHLAFQSIKKVDSDLKINLYNNIVLTGGTTLLRNFQERFDQEIHDLARQDAKTEISVSAALHRKNAAWVGGSMLASFNTFHMMTIKQQDYSETTPETEKASCILKKTIY